MHCLLDRFAVFLSSNSTSNVLHRLLMRYCDAVCSECKLAVYVGDLQFNNMYHRRRFGIHVVRVIVAFGMNLVTIDVESDLSIY